MEKPNLAPGFRFRPTDVELVRYYLKRKVMGKKFLTNAIAEIDIYKFEPPDLPDKSCLKSGDLKWYFFCPKQNKYASGSKANRSTEVGYWKVTGQDRNVSYNNEVVGKIKTLVFHYGKKYGERTDWVIHEYRLEDKALAQKNVPQDSYVVCKLFKKLGAGPRTGDEYGVPFNEEDWSSGGEEEEEEDTENLVAIENADPGGPSNAVAGVISESCVCDVPRLTASSTVVPPLITSDDDVVVANTPVVSSSSPLLEAPQALPDVDDDELYSMLDFFTVDDDDESLFLDGFDNQNEVRHEPEVLVTEEAPVCAGVGDFMGIPELSDDFRGSPELSDDLFLELQDLIEPVTPPLTPPAAQAENHGDSRSDGQS